MPENDKKQEALEKLNPQTAELEVGIRSLRKIVIYPLSMADQLRATDLIAKAMEGFTEKGDMEDTAFVAFAMEMIKQNLAKIVSMATGEDGEKLLEELSNVQGMALVEAIFDMNYASISGNVQSLAKKVKSLFPSARQSQQ